MEGGRGGGMEEGRDGWMGRGKAGWTEGRIDGWRASCGPLCVIICPVRLRVTLRSSSLARASTCVLAPFLLDALYKNYSNREIRGPQ